MMRELAAGVAAGLRAWADGMEARFHPSQDPPEWFVSGYGVTPSSGQTVSDTTALTMTAVFACVRVLSESIGSLPLILYRRLSDGGKERASEHPLYPLLHDSPNPWMTSSEWRQAQMVGLCRRGNAYSYIERNGAGRVTALWNLRADRMEADVENGRLVYTYVPDIGPQVTLLQEEVLHRRILSEDGVVGMSPVSYAREAIGTGLAMQEHGGRLFANAAMPRSAVKMPVNKRFKDDAAKQRFQTEVSQKYMGVKNSHRLLVLEDGMDWVNTSFNSEDQQFLQSRKFQVSEIARMFRVPPHMIGDLDRATFSNIEQQSLEFVIYSLMPYMVGWEQRLGLSLLSAEERKTYFFEFLADALLRGDTLQRFQAYDYALRGAWMCPDEVRERENLNPIAGGAGKVYRAPSNTEPLGKNAAPAPTAKPAAGNGGNASGDEDLAGRNAQLASLARAIAAGAGGNGTPH